MTTRSSLRFLVEGLEGLVLLPLAVLTWPLTHRWLRDWGSRPAERERHWPGDELIAQRVATTTRAISIDAAPGAVWSRVVQIGLGRAGFYSYELLERLGGLRVTNIESVEPDWQTLSVGDEVLVHPRAGVRVSSIVPERALCFGKRTQGGKDLAEESVSWSFYIEPDSDQSCRLIVRSCFGPLTEESLPKAIARGFEAALDAVMEQRMLRTLKRLSERDAS